MAELINTPTTSPLPVQQVDAGRADTNHKLHQDVSASCCCADFICIVLFFYADFTTLLFLCSARSRKKHQMKKLFTHVDPLKKKKERTRRAETNDGMMHEQRFD